MGNVLTRPMRKLRNFVLGIPRRVGNTSVLVDTALRTNAVLVTGTENERRRLLQEYKQLFPESCITVSNLEPFVGQQRPVLLDPFALQVLMSDLRLEEIDRKLDKYEEIEKIVGRDSSPELSSWPMEWRNE